MKNTKMKKDNINDEIEQMIEQTIKNDRNISEIDELSMTNLINRTINEIKLWNICRREEKDINQIEENNYKKGKKMLREYIESNYKGRNSLEALNVIKDLFKTTFGKPLDLKVERIYKFKMSNKKEIDTEEMGIIVYRLTFYDIHMINVTHEWNRLERIVGIIDSVYDIEKGSLSVYCCVDKNETIQNGSENVYKKKKKENKNKRRDSSSERKHNEKQLIELLDKLEKEEQKKNQWSLWPFNNSNDNKKKRTHNDEIKSKSFLTTSTYYRDFQKRKNIEKNKIFTKREITETDREYVVEKIVEEVINIDYISPETSVSIQSIEPFFYLELINRVMKNMKNLEHGTQKKSYEQWSTYVQDNNTEDWISLIKKYPGIQGLFCTFGDYVIHSRMLTQDIDYKYYCIDFDHIVSLVGYSFFKYLISQFNADIKGIYLFSKQLSTPLTNKSVCRIIVESREDNNTNCYDNRSTKKLRVNPNLDD
jgi:hypothetical protein